MREVFVENLSTKGKTNKIDWKNTIGQKVKFKYEDINGEVEIIDYEPKTHYLNIKYKNKEPFRIKTDNFTKCKLAGILKEELYTYTYDETNSRRVDLRNLPLNSKGIDWTQVANNKMKIPFVYDDIEDVVEIVDYDIKDQKLYIKYLNKKPFEIKTGYFSNGQLGRLFDKYTGEFKIEVGTRYVDKKKRYYYY